MNNGERDPVQDSAGFFIVHPGERTAFRQPLVDLIAWDQARGEPDLGFGLSPDDEERLLREG